MWMPEGAATPGITWLELFAGFEILGNTLDTKTVDHRTRDKATPLKSLRHSLLHFKALVIYAAKNCLSYVDNVYFNAARANGRRHTGSAYLARRPRRRSM